MNIGELDPFIGIGIDLQIPAMHLLRLDADQQRVETINYGGGARWFIKPRLAFSIDVRFYAVSPTTTAPLKGGCVACSGFAAERGLM